MTPEQRKVLDENYGRRNDQSEARVKQVFTDLDMPGIYARYEEESYGRLMKLIQNIPLDSGLPREMFVTFMNRIYKREK